MGTLKIKRGTTSQRTGFTPALAELVYDSDTKEVYVGDGSTQGGIAVSVSTQNLENLGNVQSVTPLKDQILVYNGSNWAATNNPALDLRGNIYADDSTLLVDAINGKIVGPIQTASVTATTLTGTLTGDTVGSHTGSVVGSLVGTVTGDVKGSIFADDSTVMVDANNNKVIAKEIQATTIKGSVIEGNFKGSLFSDSSSVFIDSINSTINASEITSTGTISGVGRISTTIPSALGVGFSTIGSYNSADPMFMSMSRSRGTSSNKTALLAGDDIGSIAFSDGYKNVSAVQIKGEIDPAGTPSANVAPGKLSFLVSNNSGTPLERASIDHQGTFVTAGIHNGRTTSGTGIPFYSLCNTNTVADGPRLILGRSRGTYDTPLAVASGDVMHRITFRGYDGAAYQDNAFITGRVDGTVSSGVVPSAIDIKTTSAAGSLQTVGTFGKGAFKLAVYANNTARDAAVPNPEAGMMIFNTTGQKFQGYTGSAWADLN